MVPRHILHGCINAHQSDKGVFRYCTYDQFVAQTCGQMNKCYILKDINAGIAVNKTIKANLGLHQSPSRSTMSDGNKKRYYKVFESLYYKLLRHYEGKLSAYRLMVCR